MNHLSRRRWALAHPWRYDALCAFGLVLFVIASFYAMAGVAEVGCWLGVAQCLIP